MNYKKINLIFLLAVLSLLFLISSCNKEDDASSTEPQVTENPEDENETEEETEEEESGSENEIISFSFKVSENSSLNEDLIGVSVDTYVENENIIYIEIPYHMNEEDLYGLKPTIELSSGSRVRNTTFFGNGFFYNIYEVVDEDEVTSTEYKVIAGNPDKTALIAIISAKYKFYSENPLCTKYGTWEDVFEADLNNWVGVKADPNTGRVTELNLDFYPATELPNEIRHLTELEKLNVIGPTSSSPVYCYNNLEKFPLEVFGFSKLKELRIENNKISEIPDAISVLENLQLISFKGNLVESIPTSISELDLLYHLDLRDNNLLELPKEICAKELNPYNLNILRDEHVVCEE